mgnify:CR=1 FL=1
MPATAAVNTTAAINSGPNPFDQASSTPTTAAADPAVAVTLKSDPLPGVRGSFMPTMAAVDSPSSYCRHRGLLPNASDLNTYDWHASYYNVSASKFSAWNVLAPNASARSEHLRLEHLCVECLLFERLCFVHPQMTIETIQTSDLPAGRNAAQIALLGSQYQLIDIDWRGREDGYTNHNTTINQ